MRIHLHDFAGHPFQAQLSRSLAAQGHVVEHGYAAQYVSGKGVLERTPGDPETLTFLPVGTAVPLVKYSPAARYRFERAYRRVLIRHLSAARPDVTVLCNVPLYIASSVGRALKRAGLTWVLWHQDITSAAMADEMRRRLPQVLADPICRALERRERETVLGANAVVAIGAAFLQQYERWNVSRPAVHLLPNWAPLDEIRPAPRDNAWSRRQDLPPAGIRLMYSGTLGRKHNPLLLRDLLDELARRSVAASLTVVSEGDGADLLRPHAGDRLRVLPFQAAADLPEALASADVLVAVLEEAAGRFSIPSKVLSYLAAGRAVLALMPSDNPAAEDVRAAGGMVVPPTAAGIAEAAGWLEALAADLPHLRDLGARARRYAEDRFAIGPISREFGQVLEEAA